MTNANFRRTLVGAAVAAALGVLGSPASAGPYRGSFDPTEFEGEYIIDVDAACLTTNGWHANGGICAATLLSAYADVISTSPEPDYTGRLTFAPPEITSSSVLLGIFVYGGAIQSFDTNLIHHVGAVGPTTDNWWIAFTSGHACYGGPCSYGPVLVPDLLVPDGVATIDPRQTGVYLWGNATTTPGDPIARADYQGPAVDLAIPEPGTLSLLLGALGGGWLARRRRRKEQVPDSS